MMGNVTAAQLLKVTGAVIAVLGVLCTGVTFADLQGKTIGGEDVADWVLLSTCAPVALVAIGGLVVWALGALLDEG